MDKKEIIGYLDKIIDSVQSSCSKEKFINKVINEGLKHTPDFQQHIDQWIDDSIVNKTKMLNQLLEEEDASQDDMWNSIIDLYKSIVSYAIYQNKISCFKTGYMDCAVGDCEKFKDMDFDMSKVQNTGFKCYLKGYGLCLLTTVMSLSLNKVAELITQEK